MKHVDMLCMLGQFKACLGVRATCSPDHYPPEVREQAKRVLALVDGVESGDLDRTAKLYLESLLLAFQAGRLFEIDGVANQDYAMELAQDVKWALASGLSPHEPEQGDPDPDHHTEVEVSVHAVHVHNAVFVGIMMQAFTELAENMLELEPSLAVELLSRAKARSLVRGRLSQFAEIIEDTINDESGDDGAVEL